MGRWLRRSDFTSWSMSFPSRRLRPRWWSSSVGVMTRCCTPLRPRRLMMRPLRQTRTQAQPRPSLPIGGEKRVLRSSCAPSLISI